MNKGQVAGVMLCIGWLFLVAAAFYFESSLLAGIAIIMFIFGMAG